LLEYFRSDARDGHSHPVRREPHAYRQLDLNQPNAPHPPTRKDSPHAYRQLDLNQPNAPHPPTRKDSPHAYRQLDLSTGLDAQYFAVLT
jgi:hypothetical protein